MVSDKLKLAVISGASHALKFKNENPYASDEDALRHVTREAEMILRNIEDSGE